MKRNKNTGKKFADLLSWYNRFRTALRWNNSTSCRKCHGNWWICTILQPCHPFPPQSSWASPSQLSLGAADGSNILSPPEPLPGWWHHRSPWVAPSALWRTRNGTRVSAHPPPMQLKAPAGDSSLYFINSQTSARGMSECWDLLERGDIQNWHGINPRITWRANIPCLSVLPWLQPFRGTFSPCLHPKQEIKSKMEGKINWNHVRKSVCPPCCHRAVPGMGGERIPANYFCVYIYWLGLVVQQRLWENKSYQRS